MQINIVKFLANAGVASRRKAEDLVRSGQVSVNGRIAKLGEIIDGEKDRVLANGRIVKSASEKVYLVLNKPAGYTCTNRRFKGEKNVFDLIDFSRFDNETAEARLHIVGRLDKESRGLVILTNDGDVGYKLTHPKFGHEKEYITQIATYLKRMATNECTDHGYIVGRLVAGVDVGDGDGVARAKTAEYLGGGRFRVVLTEGKKRQIRRMFKILGCEVLDLQRVRVGEITLGNLKEGAWKKLGGSELQKFLISLQ